MLMEKVFGAANFIGNIVWKNVTDNNPTRVTVEHEYILVYAVDINSVDKEWKSQVNVIKETLVNIGEDLVGRYGDTDELRTEYQRWFKENKEFLGPLDRYKYIDGGGIYTGSQSVHNPGKEGYRYDIIHPETKKPCKQPLNGYRFPQETMDKMLAEGRILFGQDESKLIEIKLYAKDYKEKLPGVIDLDGRKGPNELKNIFGDKSPFNNPKPTELILELLKFACGKNDIVLDFFAGSGSTAHAVMKLNAQDGGDRKYILVCSTEATNDEPDKNVCRNVCAERVRRVTQGYSNKKGEHVPGLGGSFAYLSTRRIPLDQVFHDVKHDQIWLALQLIHLNTITPYTPDKVTQVSTNGADKIAYVSKLTEESMAEVQAVAEEGHGNLTIYSWQPGMLRQHIQLPRITFETIPQYLIDRFSVGAAR